MNRITKKYHDSLLEELREELGEAEKYAIEFDDGLEEVTYYHETILRVEQMTTLAEMVEFEVEELEEEEETILNCLIKLIDDEEEIPEWERKSLEELNSR